MELWRNAIEKALFENEQNLARNAEYRESYSELASNLVRYRDSLSVPIMVPVCPRLFARGRLVRTNEVLVSLGQNYFAEMTTAGAVGVCERRLAEAHKTKTDLEKEAELLGSRLRLPADEGVVDRDGVEIVEPYDEDEDRKWRAEHRVRVAESKREEKRRRDEIRERLAELRIGEKAPCVTEEDVFARLDRLEEEERLQDELDRCSEGSSEESDDSDDSKESEERPKKATGKRVSFADEEDDPQTLTINFKHTEAPPVSRDIPSVANESPQSPRDVYKLFAPASEERPIKSIIKNGHRAKEEVRSPSPIVEEIAEEKGPIQIVNVLGDIVEHNISESVDTSLKSSTETNRPVSKFKSMRMKSKK